MKPLSRSTSANKQKYHVHDAMLHKSAHVYVADNLRVSLWKDSWWVFILYYSEFASVYRKWLTVELGAGQNRANATDETVSEALKENGGKEM